MALSIEQMQRIIAPPEFKNEWRELPTEDYHRDKSAVNFSSLKFIEKSEFHFAHAFWGKPKEPTPRMKFGTLAHMALLEGPKFKSR